MMHDSDSDRPRRSFDDGYDNHQQTKIKAPPKFPAPDYTNLKSYSPFPCRDNQEQILDQLEQYLVDPQIKTVIIEAATGTGKSILAMAAARASKGAYVATANKLLQDQYQRDFSQFLADLKGRANYNCRKYQRPNGSPFNCGDSPCRKSQDEQKDCSKRQECEYHDAMKSASLSSMTSFNFAAALAFLDHVKTYFGRRNLFVLDEAHQVQNWLTSFVEIKFQRNSLMGLGLAPDLPDYESVDFYKTFIENIHDELREKLGSDAELEGLDPKILHEMETLNHKIHVFKTLLEAPDGSNNFVLYKEYDKKMNNILNSVAFKPIAVNQIANDYLFKYADKTIMLSATILDFPTFCSTLGLVTEETAIIRVGSPFPKENRPFYLSHAGPSLNMSNLDQNLPQLVDRIHQVMEHYKGYKGIIHGNSYKICNFIAENIPAVSSRRILYARSAKEQKSMIQMHTNSSEPTVLLSPSMEEGVDLKDDLGRFAVLCKVPFPYLGDPIIKRRMEIYPGYYEWETALTMVQSYGRICRNTSDWGHVYALDGGFAGFINRSRHILPAWFLEAVQ